MLSKLIWRYERSRSHPVLKQHHLVQRTFALNKNSDAVTLAVLTVPKSFDDAMWSLWSWLSQLEGRVRPVLFVDGPIPPASRLLAETSFPGLVVHELPQFLADRSWMGPHLARLVDAHPLGKKLAMVCALQRTGPVLYSDSDVLAFNALPELLSCMERGVPAYVQDASQGDYDLRVITAAQRVGATPFASLNSGILFVPRAALDLSLVERILGGLDSWDDLSKSWFTEQTLFALLMKEAGAEALPKDRYVVSIQRQFYFEKDVDYRHISLRHFTGTVRHVMYLKGIPFLLKRARRG